jgi:hypothetical protein
MKAPTATIHTLSTQTLEKITSLDRMTVDETYMHRDWAMNVRYIINAAERLRKRFDITEVRDVGI